MDRRRGPARLDATHFAGRRACRSPLTDAHRESLGFFAPALFPFLAGRVISPALLAVLLVGNLVIVVFQAMLAWFRAFADERFCTQVVIACGAMAIGGAGGAALGGAMGAAAGYAAVGVIVVSILGAGFARLRVQRLTGNYIPPVPFRSAG